MKMVLIIDGEQVEAGPPSSDGSCPISKTKSGKCVGRKGCSCTTIWIHEDLTCPCDRRRKIQLEIREPV